MQKKFGEILKAFFKSKYNFLILLLFFGVLICIIIFTPLFKWSYYSPKKLASIEAYKNEEYISFDSGKEFQKFIKDFEFTSKNEPIEFYYVDNSKRDSLIYGKMNDIYILELDLIDAEYPQLKECINIFNLKKTGIYGSYEMFSKSDHEKEIVYCIAVDRINGKIRYVMVDNCNIENVSLILMRQCNVSFE